MLLRNIELDAKLASNVRHMHWYIQAEPIDPEEPAQRLLLATNEDVYVYDVRNPRWEANIKKACGDGGKIASVGFGAHANEVIVFSAFGLKAGIWCLDTGYTTEIKDPKSPSSRAHSLRPHTGHLAILTRSSARDLVTVLSPDRKKVEYTLIAATVDAQGIKWSPDGRWIVVWDTATAGTGVCVYTATGQLFKKFSSGGEVEDLGYGVQSVEWSHDSRFLIAMMNDGKVVFLNAKSFQPATVLEYPSRVVSEHARIHEEQIATDGTRSYTLANSTISPPISESALGFNFVAVSPSTDLLACVLARLPTTVWIHRFHPSPQLISVLVHHGSVKHLSWHPSNTDLLLMHCSTKSLESLTESTSSGTAVPSLYVWGYDLAEPRINLMTTAPGSLTKTAWLRSTMEPRALASTASVCSTIAVLSAEEEHDSGEFPTPKPALPRKQKFSVEATPTQMLGHDLETPRTNFTSGFSPIKMDTVQLTKTLGFQFTSLDDYETDDTFEYKKPLKATG